ncbi:MAG: family 10 glycosylhydrolase [bacterium]
MVFKRYITLGIIYLLCFCSVALATDFIIESRSGGMNYAWYSEVGTKWLDSSSKSTAAGCTAGIGSRFVSSTTSFDTARFTPNIDTAGNYEVFVAWGNSGNAYNVKYTVKYSGGTTTINLNQNGWGAGGTSNAHTWISLGTYSFVSGTNGAIEVTNIFSTGSPSTTSAWRTYADAVKYVYQPSVPVQPSEFRALWADDWHDAIKSSAETDALLNTLRSNNYNAVIIQIRLRGNAYYRNTPYEPPATDLTSGYDGLADLITKAHDTSGGKQYIEVHAAFATYPIWASGIATTGTPKHPYLAHPEWASCDSAGNILSGSNVWSDPGLPEVQRHTFSVVYHVATAYNVDGIQLDLVRYPDVDWGYNTTAVARFNEEYSRTGQPSATDNTWRAWRRRQITQLVKKIYANIMAVKPQVKVSAATISWGNTGSSGYLDAYNYEFQEWCEWMKNHYLDFNGNMAYDDTFSIWSSKCIFALDSAYGRHVYKILGAYMNAIDSTIAQASSLRVYQTTRGIPLGVSFYSYAETNSEGKTATEFESAVKTGLFYAAVSTPIMTWKTTPTKGIIKGTITLGSSSVDRAMVTLKTGVSTIAVSSTDGTGFYSFHEVTPGTNYTVTAAKTTYSRTSPLSGVTAGNVTTIDINLLSTTEIEDWKRFR